MKPDMTIVIEAETGAEHIALEAWKRAQETGETSAALEIHVYKDETKDDNPINR